MKDSKIWDILEASNRKMQTLQNQTCAQIMMLQGPTISITDINVGGVDCGMGGPCPSSLVCTNDGCVPPDMIPVVVMFANTGDIDGMITPTLSVGGVDMGIVPTEGATITVPAGGTAIATFAGVILMRGTNNVCANWT